MGRDLQKLSMHRSFEYIVVYVRRLVQFKRFFLLFAFFGIGACILFVPVFVKRSYGLVGAVKLPMHSIRFRKLTIEYSHHASRPIVH